MRTNENDSQNVAMNSMRKQTVKCLSHACSMFLKKYKLTDAYYWLRIYSRDTDKGITY